MTAPTSDPDPAGVLRRSPSVLAAAVGDGLLLVDPERVRAHGLNPSATVVWQELTGGVDDELLAERVATAVAVPIEAVRTDVAAAVDHLVGEGLVTRGASPAPPPPGPRPGTFANVPATDEPAPAGHADLDWVAHHGPFRGLDVAFDLTTTDPVIGRYLASVWASLAGDPDQPATGPVRHYRIVGSHPDPGLDHLITLDGRVVARCRSDSATVGLAVWHANQLVSTGTRRLLQLHAAAVTFDGRALVLPAAMNSGKSTLAAGLVRDGAGYLTDEAVALDPASGLVLPYPKAITLDPGSWPLFPGLEPAIQQEHPGLAHGKWYVPPEAIRPGSPAPAADPAAFVFPRYDPSAPTTLEPVAPVDVATMLAGNCFNLAEMGQAGVDLVAHLAATRPCHVLTAHDLGSALAAVAGLPIAGGAGTDPGVRS